jgi:hypothetical protein
MVYLGWMKKKADWAFLDESMPESMKIFARFSFGQVFIIVP